eukprot:15451972-Alexandrium_andersonii.AAC.1
MPWARAFAPAAGSGMLSSGGTAGAAAPFSRPSRRRTQGALPVAAPSQPPQSRVAWAAGVAWPPGHEPLGRPWAPVFRLVAFIC